MAKLVRSVATGQLQVKISGPKLDRYIAQLESEATKKAADVTVDRIKRYIVQAGRVRTGRMLRSVRARKVPGTSNPTMYRVTVDVPYYKYQNFGVRPFTAKPGKFLVFTPKGGRGVVFAKKVKGFKGGHFSERARDALSLRDFT